MLVIGASLLIAASAQVAVPLPFSPVPMTMQPLAVLLVGAALGSWRGASAAALYLAEGAAGLPFFSMGRSGIAHLLGPTAGFLFAFPLAAATAGFFAERGWTRSIPRTALAMAAALAVLHLGGFSWLVAGMRLTPEQALATGFLPFVLGDVVKVIFAALLLPTAQKLIRE